MGAVFPPAPTFLGSNPIAGEGNLFFPGRIRIRLEDLVIPTPVPLGFPTRALLPRRSPASLRTKHLCFVEASFAFPSPEGSGSAGRFGKWERLWLAPLPHASSSLALPVLCCHFHSCECPWPSGSGSNLALLPFPVGRSGCKWQGGPRNPAAQRESTCG